MSEPKFTPGPWRNADGVIHAGANDHIAVMKAIPEWEDNAALIAAAPEIYQMLERILDYMTVGPFLTKKPSVMEIVDLLEVARGER